MPLARASSATASKLAQVLAKSLRAASSEASRAAKLRRLVFSDQRHVFRGQLTISAAPALTCQTINPTEKTTATAAAIHAFVVEVKIFSFPILKLLMLHQLEQHAIRR